MYGSALGYFLGRMSDQKPNSSQTPIFATRKYYSRYQSSAEIIFFSLRTLGDVVGSDSDTYWNMGNEFCLDDSARSTHFPVSSVSASALSVRYFHWNALWYADRLARTSVW